MTIICGDALTELRKLPDESVHCCITSPPYWGLRDYGTALWEGGDPACDHRHTSTVRTSTADSHSADQPSRQGALKPYFGGCRCRKCGARRVDLQLGLEPSPDDYVTRLLEIFREVKRVLRKDGTLWLNLGDSYNSNTNAPSRPNKKADVGYWNKADLVHSLRLNVPGLKAKNLAGMPWRIAFALQADGWYLRSDIIWSKPNPMPESATDRPTKAHEYVFLLSKSARYYYDAEAIKESQVEYERRRRMREKAQGLKSTYALSRDGETGLPDQSASGTCRNVTRRHELAEAGTRNCRTVWTISTKAMPKEFSGVHFATFPPEIPERCIKAGTSEKGCCPRCGAGWVRVLDKSPMIINRSFNHPAELRTRTSGTMVSPPMSITTGWRPGCGCEPGQPFPAVVLDPFFGAGTTGLVALRLGRNFMGIELSAEYCKAANKRIYGELMKELRGGA